MKSINEQINKCETKEAVALVMAEYFNSKIEPRLLALFIANSINYLKYYEEKTNCKEQTKYGSGILYDLNFHIISALLKCNTIEEKRKISYSALIEFFSCMGGGDNAKAGLSQIGTAFIYSFSRLTHDEESIEEYISVLSALLVLSEMQSHYDFYSDEERKQSKAA